MMAHKRFLSVQTMSFIRLFVVLATPALLAGCLTIPKYQVPPGGVTANLTVKTPANPPFTTIGVSIFEDPFICSGQQVLTLHTKAEQEPAKAFVEAGKLQTIRMVQLSRTKYGETMCAPVLSFHPKPDRSYELTMINQGIVCRPVLTEVIGSESKLVDFILRPVHQTTLHRGSALCKDVIQ
jgi:hypothetical protein